MSQFKIEEVTSDAKIRSNLPGLKKGVPRVGNAPRFVVKNAAGEVVLRTKDREVAERFVGIPAKAEEPSSKGDGGGDGGAKK